MAHSAANQNGDAAHAWELMRKIGVAMLVTRDGGALRARPMWAHLAPDENRIYFLTDALRHKDEEITREPEVNLAFADAGKRDYVSVSGRAEVSNDRDRIRALFSTAAKAWWKSADDPDIRVLEVTPRDAEFWDASGALVSTIKMAAAAVTGTRPSLGDNRKVSL